LPWPPQLQDLKDYMRRTDDRDDAAMALELDAAVAHVEDQRAGDLDFDGTSSMLPAPAADIVTGTLQLAMRWFGRRQSPDGLVDMGELGSVRIPTTDADIERRLKIGRFRAPMVGVRSV